MRRTPIVLLCALALAGRPPLDDRTVAGLRVVELFAHGADRSSPLIVALHGRGGRAESLARLWDDFPGRVEVALLQAPARSGFGWAWFDWPAGTSDDDLAAAVGAAVDELWPAIVELAHGRKVIVVGFSQGAVLAYALAARHPDDIRYAFPISGGAPDPLCPHAGARAAPLYALHGVDDDIIPIDYARKTVAAFKRAGARAELREFPGVGHTITAAMREDLVAHVRAALAAMSP